MMTHRPESLFTLSLIVSVCACGFSACDDETDGPSNYLLTDAGDGPVDAGDATSETGTDRDADGSDVVDTGIDASPDVYTPPPDWTTACPSAGCPGDSTCEDDLDACRPTLPANARSCDAEPTSWEAGQKAFADNTTSWNLDALDVRGIRLSVVDYNQDGWPDLSVRRGGSQPNDFSDNGNRRVWLLRNNAGQGFEDVTQTSGLLQRRSDTTSDAPSRPAEVIVWGDVNNDGWPDAYTGYTKPTGNPDSGETAEIMINQGDGTFRLGPSDSALRRAGQPDTVSGAALTDINRDGHLDIWVGQYDYSGNRGPSQDLAYLGDGDGSFTAATNDLGLSTRPWSQIGPINQGNAHSLAWSVGACDLDGNGVPDLTASSYGRAPNQLFVGAPGGDAGVSFQNRSVSSGFAYDDNTDWTDNISAQCYCRENPDAAECGDVPSPSGISCASTRGWRHQFDREPFRLGGNNGTTVCEDLDRDGRMDLLTTTIRHWDVGQSSDPTEILYNNTAYGADGRADSVTFRRPGRQATGLTRQHASQSWDEGVITAAIFDFDNDGRPDIYIGSTDYPGTRGHLYRQTPDGDFTEVPPDVGIDHPSSHGVAAADFDRDGDVDLVVGHSRSRCSLGNHCYPPDKAHVRFFENVLGEDDPSETTSDTGTSPTADAGVSEPDAGTDPPASGRWLQLTLTGSDGTNRSAIGARVTIEPLRPSGEPVTTPDGRSVRWTQRVDGGHGHYGMQDAKTIHAGLGDACRARVTVRWPDEALTTETYVLPAGQRFDWRQGDPPQITSP